MEHTNGNAVALRAAHRRKLEAIRSARERLHERTMAAVLEAREASASLRDVGDALGISHTAVQRLEREARRRERNR